VVLTALKSFPSVQVSHEIVRVERFPRDGCITPEKQINAVFAMIDSNLYKHCTFRGKTAFYERV